LIDERGHDYVSMLVDEIGEEGVGEALRVFVRDTEERLRLSWRR
jgi:hypothetical protein